MVKKAFNKDLYLGPKMEYNIHTVDSTMTLFVTLYYHLKLRITVFVTLERAFWQQVLCVDV